MASSWQEGPQASATLLLSIRETGGKMSHGWMPSRMGIAEDSHLEYDILVRRRHTSLVTDVNHAIKEGWFPSRSHVAIVIEGKPEYSQMLTRTVYEPREAPTIGALRERFPVLFDVVETLEENIQYQARLEFLVLLGGYSE